MENIETLLAAVAQTQGFDDDEPVVSTARGAGLENSESTPANRGETGGLQPTGGVSGDARPAEVADTPPPAAIPSFPAVGQVIGAGVRRKRGRPPKVQLGAKPPPPKRKKQENEEEDVCFICFDGGSLVLCDRKCCPKAYHPACIKRDEAFFKSKAKWNCGWHLCSVCEKKASHYMCYTCTYSLCKGCTKDADYFCVRGNKGFCSTCMKTIMLIENKDQANNDSVQVDFDDRTSWEYLFKVYWECLKEKLSLTPSELTQAKKPCKGVLDIASKPQLVDVLHVAVDGKVSNSSKSTEYLELNRPHVNTSLQQNDGLTTAVLSIDNHVEKLKSDNMERGPLHDEDTVKANMDKVTDEPSIDKANDEPGIKEAPDKPNSEKDYDKPIVVKDTDKPCICKSTDNKVSGKSGIDCSTEWASKELLDFVAHARNGDTSAISQFDVQKLLLEYIKINNLWDPGQKSRIICDLRLRNLFGKRRVGHLEMLNLLKLHFLIKEDSQKSSFIPAGFVSSVASGTEVYGNTNGSMQINSRKRKSWKKSEDRAVQNNLDEYAAIDVHNINLIYLQCNLMENLLKDQENFNSKVVGSIVRIRISSNDQKQDVYRLVQVVGTIKAAGPYKIGDRTADVMLEVFNLDKKEVVSIDAISNQEFTEDECRRLRQSIRCGPVKPFTVGEVQNKAMALRPVKINDGLEAELLLLNRLRDRASENGCKKEERVDKLMLLKSPEEYQRRIAEVPEVHADPKMSPNYESEEDTRHSDSSSKDECVRPSYSGFPRNGRKPISRNKKGKEERVTHAQNAMTQKTDASGSHSSEKNMDQVSNNSAISSRSDQAMPRFWEASTATASVGNSPSANHIETEKLWHYRDPNSKIQGPFSMMQLRKWRTTGLFPPDMRIWTNHEQYDSLLLIDALNGHFHGAAELPNKPPSESQENGTSGSGDIGASEVTNATNRDGKETGPASHNNVSVLSDINTGVMREDESGSSSRPQCWDWRKDNNSGANDAQAHARLPSSSSGQTDVAPPRTGRASCNNVSVLSDNNTGVMREDESESSSWPQCWDLLKDNNSSANDAQVHEAPPSSSSGQTDVALPVQGQDSTEFNCGLQTGEKNLSGLNQNWATSGHEQHNHRNNDDQVGQSSGENLISLNIDWRSNDEEPGPVLAPASKSPDSNKQVGNIDVLDLLSPTLKTANQQSVSSDVPMQNFSCLELLSPAPRSNNEDQGATETKQSGLLNFPLPDSGTSGSGTSTGAIDGLPLSDVADEWCGYSPTPAKPSTQRWDSGLVSSSPLKPPEATSENIATLTLDGHHLTHASSSHPAPTMPNWLAILNEPIELDALGEEAVSDLLAEVDAMESQGALPSPTSALRLAKEFIEDCKDDCFSSIEDFSSAPDPPKSDALSSTGEIQLNSQSSAPGKPIETFDALDSFRRSSVHSSVSSEGETNAPVYSGDAGSEFHPPAPNNTSQDMVSGTVTSGSGSDTVDPGWGTVQGNINLVTVQGNVNLVLGGPGQGMANLGWGTNPGTPWVNPNINHSPINGSLAWDGQRKYGGERFTSPRDRGYQGNDSGFMRSRPPWGRQPYGGSGGYSRPLPRVQRVCKFYGSGHCKKGAFCDYLHHP